MSEGTIIILETAGPEYRVSVVPDSDYIYSNIGEDNKWTLNSEYIHSFFDIVKPVNTKEDAFSLASNLSVLLKDINMNIVGGIQHIDNWSHMSYSGI